MNAVCNDLETTKKERSNLNDEIKRISFRIEEADRERNISIDEAENLRKMHNEKLGEAYNEFSEKTLRLENALKESNDRIRVSESRAKEIIKLQERLSDKWKKEHFATVKYYETIVNDMQTELGKYKHPEAPNERFSKD